MTRPSDTGGQLLRLLILPQNEPPATPTPRARRCVKGVNTVAIPDGNSTSAAIWSLSALYHHGGKSRFRAKPECNRAKGSAVQNPKSLRKLRST